MQQPGFAGHVASTRVDSRREEKEGLAAQHFHCNSLILASLSLIGPQVRTRDELEDDKYQRMRQVQATCMIDIPKWLRLPWWCLPLVPVAPFPSQFPDDNLIFPD